ncbi:putative hydro-lyase [Nonomuraea typhae]|uniref:putative hydro-lyase n=1 Tax=Nonomuraea typhae TaxID=2603600 RepID=UPI0012FA922E|nr:putative hydro-lyase [Nonomuraea typhae]
MTRPDLSPGRARARFRAGVRTPTAGWCAGWTQANLIALPERHAADFRRFAELNPKPCPVLDEGAPGATFTRLFPGDLRTDLPGYRVYRDGRPVADTDDVLEEWREDLVAFLLGCSFTFEAALMRAGVPVRHVELGVNVPMFRTALPCEPAGVFAGPLVVSMRPVPRALVATAEEVTGRYPAVHGAPVHAGDPKELGIEDLERPDFGDPVPVAPGEVPVFWACGVTPQLAIGAVEFAIGHLPGHMAILDARDEDFRVT